MLCLFSNQSMKVDWFTTLAYIQDIFFSTHLGTYLAVFSSKPCRQTNILNDEITLD